ncbi:methylated-DNA--[protein]-cysteine S-methyltransferase [Microlunatus lacustris]
MQSSARYVSPVGTLEVRGGPAGLRELSWRLAGPEPSPEPDATVELVLAQLVEYFAGQRQSFDVPLDLPRLAPVPRAVLEALQTIPYGRTITYGELAARSGTGLPARAIGSIMGANPVPLVIPCHRVVAGDGLGGYSGGSPGQGIATKR